MSDNPLSALAFIAERRIEEAQRAGVFDDLPGAGKPLTLEDDNNVPEDLRMAYKVLRNAGYVPEEIAERKEVSNLVDMLERCSDEQSKVRQIRKLHCMLTRMRVRHSKSVLLEQDDPYYQQIIERISVVQQGKAAKK